MEEVKAADAVDEGVTAPPLVTPGLLSPPPPPPPPPRGLPGGLDL